MWRKGNPFELLVGIQTGAATVGSSMEMPQKITNGNYAIIINKPHPLL